MQPDLVIFDCDGVLVDTERVSNQVLREYLAELGLHLSFDETVRLFKGRSETDCLAIIEQRLERPAPSDLFEKHRKGTLDRFARDPHPIQGVREALKRVPYPTCVASSGVHAKIRRTLALTGLLPRFEGRIFSATDVPRGKPFPDLFLHAARTLDADPARCIVIEDSVPGVEAGVAAGMQVLGRVDLSSAEALEAAGAVPFSDMHDVPHLIASI